MTEVLSEHTLQTVEDLTETLETTEDILEVPFEFGPGYGVEIEYRPEAVADRVVLKIDKLEFPLVGDSAAHLFKKAGLSNDLLDEYPPELTVPLINWYLNERTGSSKALVLDGKIVAFCKVKTELYSQVEILDTALHVLRDVFGVTDVLVHNVSHDLNLTQYTLMFPQNSVQLDGGDVLMSGLFVQNSVLGREALKISGVTARDYHHNAHISENLVEQWDRRRSRVASLEGAVDGTEEPGSDVFDWVKEAVMNVFKKSRGDISSVKVLANMSSGAHTGTVLNSVLDKHSVPTKLRGYVREQYADEDGNTFYNLWNAISAVANMSEVEEKPKNVRKLMAVAGSLAAHPSVCKSCYRPTEDLDD